MKKIPLLSVIIIAFISCQKKKDFDRIYLVEYHHTMRRLSNDFEGFPPVYIESFIKIENDVQAISGIRNGIDDSTMQFYKTALSQRLMDSVNELAIKFNEDKTFDIDREKPIIYDGYVYGFLVERNGKNVLIDFIPYALPDDLKPLFSGLLKFTHERNKHKFQYSEFYLFQKKFDKILFERSKFLTPRVVRKIIHFLPPKIDSPKS